MCEGVCRFFLITIGLLCSFFLFARLFYSFFPFRLFVCFSLYIIIFAFISLSIICQFIIAWCLLGE